MIENGLLCNTCGEFQVPPPMKNSKATGAACQSCGAINNYEEVIVRIAVPTPVTSITSLKQLAYWLRCPIHQVMIKQGLVCELCLKESNYNKNAKEPREIGFLGSLRGERIE